MVPSAASGLTSYVGGVVSGKLKPSLDFAVTKNMMITSVGSIVNIFVLLAIMFIQCPANNFPHGYSESTKSVNLTSACNKNCSCLVDSFDPVCGVDNVWYLSPCHAGCSAHFSNSNGSMMFSNCSCINGEQQTAEAGYCDNSCTFFLILYIIGLTLFCSVSNLYNVPITNVILKCVDEEDKSLALGIQLILICLAMLPSPLIYGQLIDWTCILWKTSSCSDARGSCLAYDNSMLRLVMHGNTLFWRFMAAVFYTISFLLSWRKFKKLELKNVDNSNDTKGKHVKN
ncbi:hypothetical protein HELRODRAFT_188571 [Helobdella robusta]|uniref:Kazal-like domain-containing protein n=1 Tax=Helobdella robusta TaxID=6412 RepID=T1FQ49_HELRO|nr:hypothetical protein HELRODRAFT_188571 [Helobdella robusta]ESO02088.1 hypothetical protein HELRODRAFT_188571 [Helobdella robusta]